jgi:hypothetical protein
MPVDGVSFTILDVHGRASREYDIEQAANKSGAMEFETIDILNTILKLN